MTRSRILALVVLTPLIAFACGGNKLNVGSNDAGSSDAATSPLPTSDAATEPTPDASATQDAAAKDAAPTESCSFESGSGGSSGPGGDFSCFSGYKCTSGPVDIECKCPQAQCTCNGKTVPLAGGCQPGCGPTQAVLTACGVTNIVEDPSDGGGSSGATSSGGSSGGSSSSSSSSSSGGP